MVTKRGGHRPPQDYTQDQLHNDRRLAERNGQSSSSSRRFGGNREPGYRADRGASGRHSPYPAHLRNPWRRSALPGSAAPRTFDHRGAGGGRGYRGNRRGSKHVGRGEFSAGPALRNYAPSRARRRGFTPLDGASGSDRNQNGHKSIMNRGGGMARAEAGVAPITSPAGSSSPFDSIPDLMLPTRPPSSNTLPASGTGNLTPTTSISSAESQDRYGVLRSRATSEGDVMSLTGQLNNAPSRTPSLDLNSFDDTPSALPLFVPSYLVQENGSIFPPPPSRRILLDLPPLPRITMEPSDNNEYPHLLDLNGITSNSNLGGISLVDLIISVLLLRCEHMLRHFMHEDSPFYFHLEIPLAKEIMAEGVTRIPSTRTRWWMVRKGCFVTVGTARVMDNIIEKFEVQYKVEEKRWSVWHFRRQQKLKGPYTENNPDPILDISMPVDPRNRVEALGLTQKYELELAQSLIEDKIWEVAQGESLYYGMEKRVPPMWEIGSPKLRSESIKEEQPEE